MRVGEHPRVIPLSEMIKNMSNIYISQIQKIIKGDYVFHFSYNFTDDRQSAIHQVCPDCNGTVFCPPGRYEMVRIISFEGMFSAELISYTSKG